MTTDNNKKFCVIIDDIATSKMTTEEINEMDQRVQEILEHAKGRLRPPSTNFYLSILSRISNENFVKPEEN